MISAIRYRVWPVTGAFQLVREHGSIEAILECLDTRYTAPDPFDFDSARIQFGITSSM